MFQSLILVTGLICAAPPADSLKPNPAKFASVPSEFRIATSSADPVKSADTPPAALQVDYGRWLPVFIESAKDQPIAGAADTQWKVIPTKAVTSGLILAFDWSKDQGWPGWVQGEKLPKLVTFPKAQSPVLLLTAGQIEKAVTVTLIAIVPKTSQDAKTLFEVPIETEVTFLPPKKEGTPGGGNVVPVKPDVGGGNVTPPVNNLFGHNLTAAILEDQKNSRGTASQFHDLAEVYERAGEKVQLTDPASSPAVTLGDFLVKLNSMSDAKKLPEKPIMQSTRDAIQAQIKTLGYRDSNRVLQQADRDTLAGMCKQIADTLKQVQ
jgi:hypothetical protein